MELESQLVEAMACADKTDEALRPWDTAFWAAHTALEEAHAVIQPPAQRLRLADRRMMAGHARHPYRKAHDEAVGWVKRVQSELKAVNARLAALDKRTRP